jgi:transcriptional regulator with XRE-family HTH domain
MNEGLLLLIGDKIKTKRTQKNITLEQLAQKAGVSKGLISQIENNRTVPSLPVLFNIGDTLFFDGRAPHRVRNLGDGDALILVFYFF